MSVLYMKTLKDATHWLIDTTSPSATKPTNMSERCDEMGSYCTQPQSAVSRTFYQQSDTRTRTFTTTIRAYATYLLARCAWISSS
jgi:hypothetical protein